MSCPLNSDHLSQLKQFILVLKTKPDLIHHPDLKFFKDYLQTLGAEIPTKTEEPSVVIEEEVPPMEEEAKDVESDVELDMEGCIEPDELDPNQFIGDENVEVSEEDIDKSDEIHREAMKAFRDNNLDKALELFEEALKLNPVSSLLYARRGNLYLKLNKPNACIKDCTHALKLNPDSPAAFKFRGRAYRLIGKWEEAASDLREACNIDYDPQVDEWLREVAPNVRKIQEHKLKQQRKTAEAELRERQERIRKAREANAKAAEAQPQPNIPTGGMPPGMSPDFMQFLNDPEIQTAFKDPEVAQAFQDISTNPANILKYQSNPKISAIIAKLASKMGGGMPGGMPGGFPGGMPGGFPGGMDPGMFGGGFSGPNGDDVGLD